MGLRTGITIIGLSAFTMGGLYIMYRIQEFFAHPINSIFGSSDKNDSSNGFGGIKGKLFSLL